jgi:hypothetical protein
VNRRGYKIYREKNKLKFNEGMLDTTIAEILNMAQPERIIEVEQLIESAISADEKIGSNGLLQIMSCQNRFKT